MIDTNIVSIKIRIRFAWHMPNFACERHLEQCSSLLAGVEELIETN